MVKVCTYLGIIIANRNELRQRWKKRFMNANRPYYALIRAEKMKIYRTLIKPVAAYRAEFWTLNKDIAKRLATFEGRVLRRVCGGIKVNENWVK